MSSITDRIEQYFVREFQNDDNLLSLFVIGSMSDKDYVPRFQNDYDLRLLVRLPSAAFINRIKECSAIIIEELKMNFPNYEFQWSDKIGPVRHIGTLLPTITLHVLLFTQESLSALPVMHRYSYAQRYEILFGDDYIGRYAKLELNAMGLLNDIEGIHYCKRCLFENTLCYQVWEKEGEICTLTSKSETFDNVTGYEFFRYSVAKCYTNVYLFAMQKKDIILLHNLQKLDSEKDGLLKITFNQYSLKNQEYITRAIILLQKVESLLQSYAQSKGELK